MSRRGPSASFRSAMVFAVVAGSSLLAACGDSGDGEAEESGGTSPLTTGGSANAGAFGLDFGTYTVDGAPNNHATLDPIAGGGFNDDSTNDLGIDSSTDQWVHVAMVWDGTVLVTYVNGLPKITTHGGGVTVLATEASPFVLGCNPTNQACFGGYFDELRVWSVARSAAEVLSLYDRPAAGDESGLVGYWKFDEDSGTTTADAVTAGGHTPHAGMLLADSAAHLPTFIEPSVPPPLVCQ